MNHYNLLIALLLIFAWCVPTNAQEDQSAAQPQTTSLDAELEPFRPLLGKTFTASFPAKPGEEPASDVQKWERILNGTAVRMVHSVNQGDYGGETIFRYDKSKKSIVYHYFTTAGFMTVGELSMDGKTFVAHETIQGAGAAVSEVESTTVIQPNGELSVTTKMLRDSEWIERGTVTYRETPQAKVLFR